MQRLAGLLLTTMLVPLLTVVTAPAQDHDETQMGAQVFQELKSKGEVVASLFYFIDPHTRYPLNIPKNEPEKFLR